MQNNENQKTYFIYVRSTSEKVQSPRNSTTPSIRKLTVFATKSRITAGACVLTASSGSATATVSAANTMRQATLLLWISHSLMATASSAIIFPTAVSRWRKSSPTACCWSSFWLDYVSSTRMPTPSSSAGLMITRSQIVQSPRNSAASSAPSLIR